MFLCCRYLTDPMEQLAILDILQETEVKEKWPTTRISQILEEEWDINNWQWAKKHCSLCFHLFFFSFWSTSNDLWDRQTLWTSPHSVWKFVNQFLPNGLSWTPWFCIQFTQTKMTSWIYWYRHHLLIWYIVTMPRVLSSRLTPLNF